jgi:hypothetical protein
LTVGNSFFGDPLVCTLPGWASLRRNGTESPSILAFKTSVQLVVLKDDVPPRLLVTDLASKWDQEDDAE